MLKKLKISKEQAKKEFKKCKNDIFYFIEKYCYILVKGEYVNFKLYDFQKNSLAEWISGNSHYSTTKESRNVVINKARQMGYSTLVAAYVAWLCLFNKNFNVILISIKDEEAQELLQKVTDILDRLPKDLFISFRALTKKIKFGNGSRIKSVTSTPKSGRSATLDLLVIDEAAFIEENIVDKIWKSASPTLDRNKGQAFLISTPDGMGGFYYDKYTSAEDGLNDFIWQNIPWKLHPERDEKWKEYIIKKDSLTDKEFEQEYCCLGGDTIVTVRDKQTNEIKDIKVSELYELL